MKRFLLAVPGFQALCRQLTGDHVRVLMYHRFAAGEGSSQRLGAVYFANQLSYIARHHSVWTADRHLRSHIGSERISGCPVVLTIDDGYADFADVAKPLLDKHDVPAILFVVTDFVGGKIWFWWDKLRYTLDTTMRIDFDIHVAGQRYRKALSNDADRDTAWGEIATDLSKLAPTEITVAIDEVGRALDVRIPDAAPDEYAAVGWEQLNQAVGTNVVLGAHTRTHPALSKVSAQQAAEEIQSSRQEIISQTGACSDAFCYPHGQQEDYSAATISVVEGLGFEGAYVAYELDDTDTGTFEMQRYSVCEDWVDFQWKLCGAQRLLQH